MYKTVVVIDDDPDDLLIMGTAIKTVNSSYNYVSFVDPVEAVKSLIDRKISVPDYIFIDLNMPKLIGAVCLKMLREEDHLRDVVIAMISTSMSPGDSQMLLRLGADYTYQKPQRLDGYRHILQDVFLVR